jgi:hypothetical protein
MIDFDDANSKMQPGGMFERVGLTLMNIFQPELGLLRLSKWRMAEVFWLLAYAAIAILFIGYVERKL